jgi:hypothetical protein
MPPPPLDIKDTLMKTTGTVILLIGVVVGIFSMIAYVAMQDSPTATRTNEGVEARMPSMLYPLGVAGASIVVGGALMAFGKKGYRISESSNTLSRPMTDVPGSRPAQNEPINAQGYPATDVR